jgi:hypothetical protein
MMLATHWIAGLSSCSPIWEHCRVPDAFEGHLFDGLEGGDEGDAEEPEGEGPEEAVD